MARNSARTEPLVVGIDGCRGGWIAAIAGSEPNTPLLAVEVHQAIGVLLERVGAGEFAVATIDMPMGLTDSGPRPCDAATRSRLGHRSSSVFSTPPRPLLHCVTHVDAVAAGRALDGRGISIQAFNLIPKIRELDEALTVDLVDRVRESHPETAFAELAGSPLTSRKRTAEGRAERLGLLTAEFPRSTALLTGRLRGAAADDLLDAVAITWSARRVVMGTAITLGDGTVDRRGIPMRVSI